MSTCDRPVFWFFSEGSQRRFFLLLFFFLYLRKGLKEKNTNLFQIKRKKKKKHLMCTGGLRVPSSEGMSELFKAGNKNKNIQYRLICEHDFEAVCEVIEREPCHFAALCVCVCVLRINTRGDRGAGGGCTVFIKTTQKKSAPRWHFICVSQSFLAQVSSKNKEREHADTWDFHQIYGGAEEPVRRKLQ